MQDVPMEVERLTPFSRLQILQTGGVFRSFHFHWQGTVTMGHWALNIWRMAIHLDCARALRCSKDPSLDPIGLPGGSGRSPT